MKPTDFESRVDQAAVAAAIARAEQKTSGEIRVMVSRRNVTEPVAVAEKEFVRLGMTQTRERNAVLLFVAPKSQCFAIVGDTGIHQKCGAAFWSGVAAEMSEHFRAGDFTRGLVAAVERLGVELAADFPRRPDDVNELPDNVAEH